MMSLMRHFLEHFMDDPILGLADDIQMPEVRMPKTTIKSEEKEYVVNIEVPGFKKEEIELELRGRHLLLSAKHVEEKKTEEENPSKENKNTETKEQIIQKNDSKEIIEYKESYSSSQFQQQIMLPRNVDTENVSTTLENGVLTLKFAKKPEIQSQKLEIN